MKCFGVILEKPAFILELFKATVNIDEENVTIHTLEQDIPLEWRLDAAGDIASALLYLHKVDMM